MITTKAIDTLSGRRMFRRDESVMLDGYDTYVQETLTDTAMMSEAHLVTSLDSKGLHRPTLDIDVPIVKIPSSWNSSVGIWVDVKCSNRAYRNLLQVLREFRIVDVSNIKVLDKDDSARAYAIDAVRSSSPRPLTNYLIEHAPSFRGSYDQLLREGAEAVAPKPIDLVQARPMRNPRFIPLHVDSYLVMSSTHHHLYLNTILSWDGYARVLWAFKKAHIIDDGWYKMALRTKRTDVRVPWLKKADPRDRA